MDKYCIILTTFESEEQANPIVRSLIEEKLAACIQVTPIKSHYYWDGNICCDNEVLVIIKTRDILFPKVKEFFERKHPYHTPEVIKINITEGADSYLRWIKEVTLNE